MHHAQSHQAPNGRYSPGPGKRWLGRIVRARRHGQVADQLPEARRQVIRVETVEQVLDPQPQVGIAFDHQATPEKQGIRIFLPTGQQQELPPTGGQP